MHILHFKRVLKCLTEVLTHQLEAYCFSEQKKKEHLQTSLHSGNTLKVVITIKYYYLNVTMLCRPLQHRTQCFAVFWFSLKQREKTRHWDASISLAGPWQGREESNGHLILCVLHSRMLLLTSLLLAMMLPLTCLVCVRGRYNTQFREKWGFTKSLPKQSWNFSVTLATKLLLTCVMQQRRGFSALQQGTMWL